MPVKCQRFNRIKQINNVIKDRDSRGFFIRFLNVIITRSSIVEEVFPFDRRISCNCIAKNSHGEWTENDERSHIVPGIVEPVKWLEETRSLEDEPQRGRPFLTEDQITAVETIMKHYHLAAESFTKSASKMEGYRLFPSHRLDVSSTWYYISIPTNCTLSRRYNQETQIWENHLPSGL